MSKPTRNTRDPESRAFWEQIEASSAEIKNAPSWMRAGITLDPHQYNTYASAPAPDDEE